MAFIQYLLAAVLGSVGVTTPGATRGTPAPRTLNADTVSQPLGGTRAESGSDTGLFSQDTGGDKRAKKGASKAKTASHHHHHKGHKGHRHPKTATGKKATKSEASGKKASKQ